MCNLSETSRVRATSAAVKRCFKQDRREAANENPKCKLHKLFQKG